VQVKASSTCFQLRSASEATPTCPWGGGESAETPAAWTCEIASGRSTLVGGSLEKKTFGSAVMMWKCLDSGSRLRKMRIVTQWIHHPTSLIVRAVERLRPPIAAATAAVSGAKSRSLPWMLFATRVPASYNSPPTMISMMKTRIRFASQCGAS
jgi:hypothetical protein